MSGILESAKYRSLGNDKGVMIEGGFRSERRLIVEPNDMVELTPQEVNILRLFLSYLSHSQIREALDITKNTLACHIRHIFEALEDAGFPKPYDVTGALSKLFQAGVLRFDDSSEQIS